MVLATKPLRLGQNIASVVKSILFYIRQGINRLSFYFAVGVLALSNVSYSKKLHHAFHYNSL